MSPCIEIGSRSQFRNPILEVILGLVGHVLELKCSIELLASGKWDSDSPWHAVSLQLIKLLPVIDCDEVFTKASALGNGLKSLLLLTVMG